MRKKRGTVFDLDLGQRIGNTASERLAWIIRFAEMELAKLRPEERVALARDMAVFPFIATRPRPVLGVTPNDEPIEQHTLMAIHEELRRGLRELMTGSGEWLVPGLKQSKIVRITPKRSPVTFFMMTWDAAGDARAAVLGAVAGLIMKHGHKVRACPECGKVFVATRRQQYCDARCSQRVRNQRRKEKEG